MCPGMSHEVDNGPAYRHLGLPIRPPPQQPRSCPSRAALRVREISWIAIWRQHNPKYRN
jgi:hypothetical protein